MGTSDAAYQVATSAAAARALLQSMAELIVDDETAEIIIDTETTLPDAIAAALNRIDVLESHAEALSGAVDRMEARMCRFAANVATLRRSIQSAMETVNLRKLELPVATLSLRTTPRSVVIVDADQVPASYKRHPPPVPDKTLIKSAINSGLTVAGAELSNGGVTLSIGRK
tara:strand:- start:6094 stop:6606 length:513 start_codon:yes stop_codon:yes gene_type:complete